MAQSAEAKQFLHLCGAVSEHIGQDHGTVLSEHRSRRAGSSRHGRHPPGQTGHLKGSRAVLSSDHDTAMEALCARYRLADGPVARTGAARPGNDPFALGRRAIGGGTPRAQYSATSVHPSYRR